MGLLDNARQIGVRLNWERRLTNVIEATDERREALINAWGLTRKVLIVTAQVLIDERVRGVIAYGDGIITSRNALYSEFSIT